MSAARVIGLFFVLMLVGCHERQNAATDGTPSEHEPTVEMIVVDTVKNVSDPKAGFFGAGLRNVYLHEEDQAKVFCDAGPSIPTGTEITVFFRDVGSTPKSTACKKLIAVIKGEGVWYNGRAISASDLAEIRSNEDHVIPQFFGEGSSQTQLAWRNPTPSGKPCPDVAGSPGNFISHSKGTGCSIAVVYTRGPGYDYVLLLNWNVKGSLDEIDPSPGADHDQVVRSIGAKYGPQYVIYK